MRTLVRWLKEGSLLWNPSPTIMQAVKGLLALWVLTMVVMAGAALFYLLLFR